MTPGTAKKMPDGALRFTLRHLPRITWDRYPVAIEPPEKTVAIVTGDGWQTGGIYQDGAWRRRANGEPFKRPVKFWTISPDLPFDGNRNG